MKWKKKKEEKKKKRRRKENWRERRKYAEQFFLRLKRKVGRLTPLGKIDFAPLLKGFS